MSKQISKKLSYVLRHRPDSIGITLDAAGWVAVVSPDEATARRVGARRGQPVILIVQAGDMHRDGHAFQRADNGVWLTPHVPPRYIGNPSPTGR